LPEAVRKEVSGDGAPDLGVKNLLYNIAFDWVGLSHLQAFDWVTADVPIVEKLINGSV